MARRISKAKAAATGNGGAGSVADLNKELFQAAVNLRGSIEPADYMLANPPFNDGAKGENGWGADRIPDKDPRLIVGGEKMPLSPRNANTMWIMHFLHHLKETGTAGFVMATGELSNSELARMEVRKALVEHNYVDCIVQLSGQLFANTQIPCALWFLSKNRRGAGGYRKRDGEILFIDGFKATLPAPQSDLAAQLLKDPYNFDFLTLRTDAAERDLEQGLLAHIRKFLLELGAGFAFVGQQVHLEVDGEDFYVDLLFYHLRLRCFIVIDLKAQPFKPEFAGKMNFYLSAVDDLLRHPDDKPSIGLVLCKTRSKVIAEYALRDLAKPVGVARYVTRLVESLPAGLRGSLPTIKQIEAELKGAKGAGDGT